MKASKGGLYQQSDEKLMEAVSAGNRAAFEILYDRYFDKLVWFANGFTGNTQKAEDLVQEVFIRIMETPERFDASRRFSTWVYTLTGNLAKNLLRDEVNRKRILDEKGSLIFESSTEMQHEMDSHHLQNQIRKAHSALNEKEKMLYTLRFEQELSIKEIAGINQMPEGSVKSGLYYLLRKMVPFLKEFSHEPRT